MPRRNGFLHALARAQRDAEHYKAAQVRAQREHQRMQEQYARAVARAEKQETREQARLYLESRTEDVAWQNEQLEQVMADLEGILEATLPVDDYLDLDELKRDLLPPVYRPPPDLGAFQRLMPGAKARHAAAVAAAVQDYEAQLRAYEEDVAYNEEADRFQAAFAAAEPGAITDYFAMVLEASVYPEDFPQHAKLAYIPESKQLVVEYDLPSFDVIPDVSAYKYVKARDEIVGTPRPLAQRKRLYASVIAQVTLRCIHEVFEADRSFYVETVVFNGYVDSIDRSIGRPVRTCVVTVRITRDVFAQFDLAQVDPIRCLRSFASISTSPDELVPVRPVLEFSMIDPRFVEETDVLTTLDQRPNLMDLSPTEFESLIANLFSKMGLETRLTQASRDGGVDCVAYDPRPIFGGKVVIQAKRYKNTVGVSAVRDLWGTTQNEGASKGILVTTSGYGAAAFEFAKGKPLELLDGGNLLYLLQEYAGMSAKIEMPEGWRDPTADTVWS